MLLDIVAKTVLSWLERVVGGAVYFMFGLLNQVMVRKIKRFTFLIGKFFFLLCSQASSLNLNLGRVLNCLHTLLRYYADTSGDGFKLV
jgi:hypothetical protein